MKLRLNRLSVILLILSLAAPAGLIGQNPSAFGEFALQELSYGLQSTMRGIYPGPNGTSYVITSQKPAIATSISLQTVIANKLDANFVQMEEFKMENVKFNPRQEEGGLAFFSAGGQLYVFSVDNDDNQVILYLTPVEHFEKQKAFAQFKGEGKTRGTFARLIQSPDLSKFAAIVHIETKENIQSFIITFNEKLEKVDEYKIIHNSNVADKKFAINNAGNIFGVEISDNDPGKKEKKLLSFNFMLLKNGKQTNSYPVNSLEQETSSMSLATDNVNFYSQVLCSHTAEVVVKGKKENQQKYSLLTYTFGPELQLVHEQKNDIPHSKIEQITHVDKFTGDNIALKGTFPLKDGSMILVGEASDDYEVSFHHTHSQWVQNPVQNASNPYPMKVGFEQTTITTKQDFKYTGIFVMHLDPAGLVQETKVIERVIYGAFQAFYTVNPIQVNESVFFTYWEIDRLTHIVKFDIDSEGKLEKHEKTLDQDQLDGRAIESSTVTTDHNHTLYAKIDHPRKKAKVLKVEFN